MVSYNNILNDSLEFFGSDRKSKKDHNKLQKDNLGITILV